MHEKKWVSGTRLNYYFFDRRDDGEWLLMNNGRQRFFSWVGGGHGACGVLDMRTILEADSFRPSTSGGERVTFTLD